MAEIPLYFVDLQDDLDDYGFEDCGPDCDSMRATAFLDIPGQGHLPPLTRLEKYAFSDNVFNRQVIARGLLDIFRDFSNDEGDFLTVMAMAVRLSEDAEPTVRTELMEQIPPIAIFLQENRSNFPLLLSEYLIPVVVRCLTDPHEQVSGTPNKPSSRGFGFFSSLKTCRELSKRACALCSASRAPRPVVPFSGARRPLPLKFCPLLFPLSGSSWRSSVLSQLRETALLLFSGSLVLHRARVA
uniref:Protein phosphatase 4 regulatory subunit 1 n=1 Tax=Rousettus aegyptiacus TaxID=9407 RepID=A0A7J8DIB9_ROUAE|nr:hypothetical protein HJG63_008495 [Rousettus aegyptiacus]